MQRFVKVLCLGLMTVSLVACNDVEIEGGEVPAQYIDYVKPLTGTYSGLMENGRPVNLEFALVDHKVVARVLGDFLGEGCETELGRLKRVKFAENAGGRLELERAVFALDPNKCAAKIQGREFELTREDSVAGARYSVRIHSENARHYFCEPTASLNGASVALRQSAFDCRWEESKDYLSGSLAKRD